jgi:hypothetical protein
MLGALAIIITGCNIGGLASPGGDHVMMPLIDRQRPAETEKAAFALG